MNGVLAFLLSILKGALIGTGAILPGISGGVLCVLMGVYRPMMAFLAHPFREFKARWAYFLPILIGFALGVLLLSKLLGILFRTSEIPSIWLFVGLIAGTLPSLLKEAGEQGRDTKSWIAMGAAFALMLTLLIVIKSAGSTQVTPNFLWWIVAGVFWGVGLLVPGMSPSTLLLFFGLYQPMTDGIGALDFAIILPLLLGLGGTVALLAKGMQRLLTKHYSVTMHVVMGVTLASSLMIIPLEPLYIACCALGLLAALWMARMNGIKPKDD